MDDLLNQAVMYVQCHGEKDDYAIAAEIREYYYGVNLGVVPDDIIPGLLPFLEFVDELRRIGSSCRSCAYAGHDIA